ncbi:MAG: aminopeptidase N, partial [Candidatus Dormiibacterota bacterium]
MLAPSSNLSHAEARERARLIDDLAYFIEWDLTGPETSYGFEARIEFSGREIGALTFAELEVPEVTEMACNGVALPASAYDGQRISLPPLAARNSLLVRGRAAYERTGLGLHRSVDPADESVYIYSDF